MRWLHLHKYRFHMSFCRFVRNFSCFYWFQRSKWFEIFIYYFHRWELQHHTFLFWLRCSSKQNNVECICLFELNNYFFLSHTHIPWNFSCHGKYEIHASQYVSRLRYKHLLASNIHQDTKKNNLWFFFPSVACCRVSLLEVASFHISRQKSKKLEAFCFIDECYSEKVSLSIFFSWRFNDKYNAKVQLHVTDTRSNSLNTNDFLLSSITEI